MKNYLSLALLAGLVFVSCRKDRTCNCTVTTTGTTAIHTQTDGFPPIIPAADTTTYQPLYSVNTVKTNYTKVSKNAMRGNCYSRSEETLNNTTVNSSPGIFTITTTDSGTKTYSCKIE